jgi:hypothetical protein
MPSDAQGKIYPQFLRIKPGQLLAVLYALAHRHLGILRLGNLRFFAYDEVIQEQEVPGHKTITISTSTPGREVEQQPT